MVSGSRCATNPASERGDAMKIFDINVKHGIALIEQDHADDRGFKIAYVPLTEDMADKLIDEPFYDYLKQRHYVARAHPAGLIMAHVDDMLDGWKQLEGHWMHGADFKYPSRSKR